VFLGLRKLTSSPLENAPFSLSYCWAEAIRVCFPIVSAAYQARSKSSAYASNITVYISESWPTNC
jgi:hypothetical protein